jgi:hypothetical protein
LNVPDAAAPCVDPAADGVGLRLFARPNVSRSSRAAAAEHIAHFGQACQGCPLAERCTTSPSGRSIHVGVYEQQLTRARAQQTDPAWKADYTATRPKVERKIAHLMRRRHGGRRARVRGHTKVDADFSLLAAAVNLARLATLGVTHHTGGWAANTA